MIKKILTFIIKAILSVLLAFVILTVFAGLNVEVSERLSYIWLVLSVGAWVTIGFIRRRKRHTQKKSAIVNNTVPTNKPETIKPIKSDPTPEPVPVPRIIVETHNQVTAEQEDAVKQKEDIKPVIPKKVAAPKDELAKLKEERLANCIYDLVVIDFETTGLNSNFLNDRMDEVLSVAIIDQDGNTLLSTLCGTSKRKTWAKAEEIHGISPAMVKGLPTFSDILPQVKDILYKARKVIAYNIPFEMGFLWAYDAINDFPNGTKIREMVDWGEDPMLMHAAYKGVLTKYNDFKWHKLAVAAEHFKYPFKAHDALEDVKATLHVYKSLLKYIAAYDDKEYILKYGKCYKKP